MNHGYSSSLSDPDNSHPRDCNCDECTDKRRTGEQAQYLARGKWILEQCLELKRAREEAELSKPKQEEESIHDFQRLPTIPEMAKGLLMIVLGVFAFFLSVLSLLAMFGF